MSLDLDARQRAMLQEMGITVWKGGRAAGEPAAAAAPTHPGPSPARPARPLAAPAPARPAAPAQPSIHTAPAPNAHALVLHPPRLLYPAADPAQVPAGLGSGWLIVTECADPADPLTGDSGQLLDNMLRAMQLHRHPRVFLTAVERRGTGLAATQDAAGALDATVADLQPAMVLVLGHVAARAALGRSEPLGRLRADPHEIAGRPAVVSYDAAFLLRSPDNKAAAWADLRRALAMVSG
jgi:DNA polymerase